MAGTAIKIVKDYLEKKEIKTDQPQEDLLTFGTYLEQGKIALIMQFLDDNHVQVTGFDFVEIPESKMELGYKLANTFNYNYNFMKFIVDEKNRQLTIRNEAVIQFDSCAEECEFIIQGILSVANKIYPEIMKALWG